MTVDPRFDPRKREAERIEGLLTEKAVDGATDILRAPVLTEGRDLYQRCRIGRTLVDLC